MKKYQNFFSENFQLFLAVNFSVHLNRYVFVMCRKCSGSYSSYLNPVTLALMKAVSRSLFLMLELTCKNVINTVNHRETNNKPFNNLFNNPY